MDVFASSLSGYALRPSLSTFNSSYILIVLFHKSLWFAISYVLNFALFLAFQVLYVLVLLHFATLCLVSGLAIYGAFKVSMHAWQLVILLFHFSARFGDVATVLQAFFLKLHN